MNNETEKTNLDFQSHDKLSTAGSSQISDAIKSIQNSALALLTRREYSRKELQLKLGKKYSNKDAVESVLDELSRQNLQSDERFAEHYIRYKAGQGKGPNLIRQELDQKGVSSAIYNEFLYSDYDWGQIASEVYTKKFGQSTVETANDKAKRMRFMYSRGFDSELIHSLF